MLCFMSKKNTALVPVNAAVNTLKLYALSQYEQGGHWVSETYNTDNYMDVLQKANGNLDEAKTLLRRDWELCNEQQAETRWE
jgi:hypothetical protein